MKKRMELHKAAIRKHAFFHSAIALCCTLSLVIVLIPLAATARTSENTALPSRHRSSYRMLQTADYVLQTSADDHKKRCPLPGTVINPDDPKVKPDSAFAYGRPERSLVAADVNPSFMKRRTGSSE